MHGISSCNAATNFVSVLWLKKMSFELHSLKDRIGENRGNSFVVLIFVLVPHSSGESFVRPSVLES